MNSRLLVAIGLAATIVVGTGCSSSKSVGGGGSTASVIAVTTIGPEPPVPAPATTVAAPVTTLETTTTTTTTMAPAPAPAPAALVLRGDGIGAFTLGDVAPAVVAGVTEQLGAPTSDVSAAYPIADGIGHYTTVDGEMGFLAPLGRTVCWSVEFCAEFGGAAGDTMSFTGWSYRNDPTTALHSTSGVTLLTSWSSFPAITADEGGCYSIGSGQIDGIRLTLQSDGEPFGSFDDLGNYVIGSPDPADVTVVWMETGEVPVFLFGDC